MYTAPYLERAAKEAAVLMLVNDNAHDGELVFSLGRFIAAYGEYLHCPSRDAEACIQRWGTLPRVIAANYGQPLV